MSDIQITEDGGVIKRILVEGTGEETPSDGNTIQVTYIGKLEDGTEFDSSTDKENPFEFKVGVGQVIKGWDLGMVTMKKGERAVFTLKSDYAYGASGSPPKIPANATLIFEVEMLGWTREKGDYPFEERYKLAEQEKQTGNELFKKQQFKEASQHYTEAVEWLETMYDQDQAQKDQRVVRNNLAAVYLKLRNYTGAIFQTTKILEQEPENQKALFRRGQAYNAAGELENAKVDLKLVYSLDSKNNAIISELQSVQNKIKKLKAEEKQKFGNLFSKSMYDDKEDVQISEIVDNPSNPNNTKVFMDIKIGEAEAERVEIELYDNVVPKTTKNFKELCKTHFKNCIFHRNIKNFMIQGGDYTNKNGTGGKSIYGEKFNDENFNVKHTKRGQLSMANAGPNTNGSQFFVLYKDTPHLDGKHVVFGEVYKNLEFLEKLENSPTGDQDKPVQDIVIVDCGVVSEGSNAKE